MASYKQPCIHCGELVERDAHFCPRCGSKSPFGYLCPHCRNPIQRGNMLCSSCSKPLMTNCPWCGGPTFAGAENCDRCGKTLLKRCGNSRCGDMQFFENTICTTCGKKF